MFGGSRILPFPLRCLPSLGTGEVQSTESQVFKALLFPRAAKVHSVFSLILVMVKEYPKNQRARNIHFWLPYCSQLSLLRNTVVYWGTNLLHSKRESVGLLCFPATHTLPESAVYSQSGDTQGSLSSQKVHGESYYILMKWRDVWNKQSSIWNF